MKLKKKQIKNLAILLVLILFVSAIPVTPVCAEYIGREVIEEIAGKIQSYTEEISESYNDYRSVGAKAGDWGKAHFHDHLSWNFFHILVQEYIVQNSDNSIQKELPIKLKDENGKIIGNGRADLYMKMGEYTYLWEVKPYSYSVDPKKSLGEKQLENYVKSGDTFLVGGAEIENGKFPVEILSVHKGYTEYVKYTIHYTVETNGLILYKFEREVTKVEPNHVAEPIMVSVDLPQKIKATNEIVSPVLTVNDCIEPVIEVVNRATVISLVAFAISWKAESDALNSHPSTVSSASLAISKYLGPFILFGTTWLDNPLSADAAEVNAAIEDFEEFVEIFGGEDLATKLEEALEAEDAETIEEILKAIQEESLEYEKAGEAQPPRDPLIIDFGSRGIELRTLEDGVNFDLDNNGFAERTAWIGIEDGFLAFDRNDNGVIDNGSELFGDQVILGNGLKSSSGFEALAEFDENLDKKIDYNDSVYDKLLVWFDENHNGFSENNELKTLRDKKVISISLEHTETSFVDEETGTRVAESANVEIDNMGIRDISEFWFPINSSDTTQGDVITVGNVPSLSQAICADETGELFELCYQFSESANIAEKRYLLKQILYFITKASDIPVNSRGGNIDARDLKVIEQFMGREFIGVGGSNPNSNAANILKEIYYNIEKEYYNVLNMYSGLGGYLKVVYEYTDENQNEVLILSALNSFIEIKIANGENVDSLIYDLGIYLDSYDERNHTKYFEEYGRRYSTISSHYADIVELSKSGNTYLGTTGNDSYSGSSQNDFIFGEAGNDSLAGGNGSDYLYGSSGDDSINGGSGRDFLNGFEGNDVLDGNSGNDILQDISGNDTYFFAKGYGNDIIIDSGGSNTLCFTDLNPSDILVNGTEDYNVTIKIKNTDDTLVIRDFCYNEALADYKLSFKEVTLHCTDEGSPFKHIYGTNADDILKAVVEGAFINAFEGNDTIIGSKGRDIIYGNEGNDDIISGEAEDTVYGGNGNDLINGDGGVDILWGEDGKDTLDGGCGNDYLFGGSGDDTYVYGNNYGIDVLEDYDGVSTVELIDDLSIEDIIVYAIGDEAIIVIKDTEDMLIISDYKSFPDKYFISVAEHNQKIEEIITDWTDNEFLALNVMVGTDESDAIFAEEMENFISSGKQYDYIVGSVYDDIIGGNNETDRIIAGDGNDVILGGGDNDQLYGEDDNDFIVGGNGNDYINCGNGDDIIIAGVGDDFIDGSNGNDTYYFHIGDGNDSIADSVGSNIILFGDSIYANQIKAYRHNWNDLLIVFKGLKDTLTLKDYCINSDAQRFFFIFADGTMFSATDENSVLRNINDASGTEYMSSIYTDGITIISTSGNDQLTGTDSTDTLIGGDGNNRIIGNSGNDSLDGGKGKDYLSGGPDSDTYIYNRGYETDTICDSEGANSIEISGYSWSDIKAYRTNWNDIALIFDGSGEKGLYDDTVDKIIIEGFYTSELCRNFYLSFNGSRIHATANNSPIRTIYGTSDNDYMQGFDNRNIVMYGCDNTDTLNGANSNDYLYGGEGDDRILGFDGEDTLSGESGNDYLEGGAGNDIYIFTVGAGMDTINDNQGINLLYFNEAFKESNIVAYRSNWYDLKITFQDMEDTIILQGYFSDENSRKYDVQFANGSKYDYFDLSNPINQIHLSENDDWMGSWSDRGICLYGDAGSDNLTGGAGSDILAGCLGNDTVSGGDGDDMYLFGYGDGSDIIFDVNGSNTVFFTNIALEDIDYYYETLNDIINLTIIIRDTEDKILIRDYKAENFVFEFSEGKKGTIYIDEAELFWDVLEKT